METDMFRLKRESSLVQYLSGLYAWTLGTSIMVAGLYGKAYVQNPEVSESLQAIPLFIIMPLGLSALSKGLDVLRKKGITASQEGTIDTIVAKFFVTAMATTAVECLAISYFTNEILR